MREKEFSTAAFGKIGSAVAANATSR